MGTLEKSGSAERKASRERAARDWIYLRTNFEPRCNAEIPGK